MWRACGWVTVVSVLTACPVTPGPAVDAGRFDAGADDDAGVRDAGVADAGVRDAGEGTAALWAPDHLLEVHVELPVADWETLRHQTRDLFALLTGDCLAQPFPSPFTDFEGSVTVDGERFDQVRVRKKGFLGSLSTARPSLKLKFDAYVDDQAVQGSDTLTLNNAQQDPAIVRQCLGYSLFAKAGVPASRCNYAHVVVNGEDLGVYVNVEAVDKDFLRRRSTGALGNLYEGTLSDFSPVFIHSFEQKNGSSQADLQRVLDALAAPEAELVTRLSPLVDLDAFVTYWAMETLLRHWDGYANNANNFFLYDDPKTGKFVFLPWGVDAVMVEAPVTAQDPEGVFVRSELARRLWAVPSVRAQLLAEVRALLDSVFDEAALRAEVTRMQLLISNHLHPLQSAQFTAGLTNLRRFIDLRRARLTQLLAAPEPDAGPARGSICLRELGRFQSDFAAPFGSLNASDPFAGTSSYLLELDGGVEPAELNGCTAGLDVTGTDGPRVGVNLFAARADAGFTATVIRVMPELYPPSQPEPFDLFARVGYVFRFEGGLAVPVGILQGTLEFSDAGVSDGGLVAGRVDARVLSWPFAEP